VIRILEAHLLGLARIPCRPVTGLRDSGGGASVAGHVDLTQSYLLISLMVCRWPVNTRGNRYAWHVLARLQYPFG